MAFFVFYGWEIYDISKKGFCQYPKSPIFGMKMERKNVQLKLYVLGLGCMRRQQF